MTDRLAAVGLRVLAPLARLLGPGDEDALENVDTTELPNGSECYVVSSRAPFRLHKDDSTTPPDGVNVIQPASGPGRWFIETGTGSGIQIENETGTLSPIRPLVQTEGQHPVDTGTAIQLRDGEVDVLAYASLSAAAAANPGRTLLLLDGSYTLDASITDPSITLKFKQGAVLNVPVSRSIAAACDFSEGGLITPANGVTVTMQGACIVSQFTRIFDITAGGSFAQNSSSTGSLPVCSVKNFGAVGDSNQAGSSGTDDTAAIRAAIAFVSSQFGVTGLGSQALPRLHFPAGTYKVTEMLVIAHAFRWKITGDTENTTIVWGNVPGVRSMIQLYNSREVTIEDLELFVYNPFTGNPNGPLYTLESLFDINDPDLSLTNGATRLALYNCVIGGGTRAALGYSYAPAVNYDQGNDQLVTHNCQFYAANAIDQGAAIKFGNPEDFVGSGFTWGGALNMIRMTMDKGVIWGSQDTTVTSYGVWSDGGCWTITNTYMAFGTLIRHARGSNHCHASNLHCEVVKRFADLRGCGGTPFTFQDITLGTEGVTSIIDDTFNGQNITYTVITDGNGPLTWEGGQFGVLGSFQVPVIPVIRATLAGSCGVINFRGATCGSFDPATPGSGAWTIPPVNASGRISVNLVGNIYYESTGGGSFRTHTDDEIHQGAIGYDPSVHWDANAVSDLGAWLDARDITPGAVSAWSSRLGSDGAGLDVTDLGNAAQQPTADGTYVIFPNTQDRWLRSAAYVRNTDETIVVSGLRDIVGAVSTLYIVDGITLNTRSMAVLSTIDRLEMYAGSAVAETDGEWAINVDTSFAFLWSGAASAISAYGEVSPFGPLNPGAGTSSGWTIGGNGGAHIVNEGLSGKLRYVLRYTRKLTETELTVIYMTMPGGELHWGSRTP